jgi:hypothetical protein
MDRNQKERIIRSSINKNTPTYTTLISTEGHFVALDKVESIFLDFIDGKSEEQVAEKLKGDHASLITLTTDSGRTHKVSIKQNSFIIGYNQLEKSFESWNENEKSEFMMKECYQVLQDWALTRGHG